MEIYYLQPSDGKLYLGTPIRTHYLTGKEEYDIDWFYILKVDIQTPKLFLTTKFIVIYNHNSIILIDRNQEIILKSQQF